MGRWVFRSLFALYFVVFLADTFNVDALYAALFEKVNYVDNADIQDSLFDVGRSVNPFLVTRDFQTNAHSKAFQTFAYKNTPFGNYTVYEDVDSPSIEDAQVSPVIFKSVEYTRKSESTTTFSIPLNRVLLFQQFLI